MSVKFDKIPSIVGFEQLHNHTDFSTLDGYAQVEEYAERCTQINMDYLCVTDHGMMGVIPRQIRACDKMNIKPIFGCLLKGQTILTINGIKPVEDIKIGDMVMTHKGRYRPVMSTMSRSFSGKVVTVKIGGGRKTLKLTGEHPILVRDYKGNISWVKAGELTGGRPAAKKGVKEHNSFVCFPRQLNSELDENEGFITTLDILPEEYSCNKEGFIVRRKMSKDGCEMIWTGVRKNIKITPEISYLLGLFAARGSFATKAGNLTGRMKYSLNTTDEDLINKIKSYLWCSFGVITSICSYSKTQYEVVFNCLPLAHIFASLVGRGNENKKIPAEILHAPAHFKTFFLQGFLNGSDRGMNYAFNPNKKRILCTWSKELAWGMKRLLASLGVWANIYERHDDNKTRYVISHGSLTSYRQCLFDSDYLYKPVSDVAIENMETTVYNFEVKEDNSYVSDFVLHNCELYVNDTRVHRDDIKLLPPDERAEASTSYHLLAIAYNNVGYSNLVQLTSWGWLNGFYRKPRVNHEQLMLHREGIIFTSCCYNSEVGKAFDRGGEEAGFAMIEKYMAMFPGNYYLELMLLDFHKQKPYDAFIIKAAQKYGLPLIVTNDCHYCNKNDSRQQQYMLMIRGNTTIRDVQMKVDTGEDVFEMQDRNLYFKSEAEMNEKWQQMYSDVIPYELFTKAKLNTVEVCRKAAGVELDRSVKLPQIPEANQKLLSKLKYGVKWRGLRNKPEYMKRLQEEYELIARKGFSSYFLIQQIMTDEARRTCPQILGWDAGDFAVGPGRGSAVGSLVCYCLGITNVDPIRHGLLFSRFLNESRGGRQIKTRFTAPPILETAA